MLYDLSLRIRYRYRAAAEQARQVLHLRPLDIPGVQRVIAAQVTVEPRPSEWETRADFFGNTTDHIAVDVPHEVLSIRMKARVDRMLAERPADHATPRAALADELRAQRNVAGASPLHFLAASPRIADLPQVTRYGEAAAGHGGSVLAAVEGFGLALHADMRFDPDATTVSTPPAEAFALRHGVCQDFSHIMIAGLRGMGIPAAYVSGFLRTVPPPGKPRLEGADAMHAWVRAWCGAEQGWVEYDPTNACFAGADHIVAGYGRDYGDVSPVRGTARSAGSHSGDHEVDVIPLGPA